MEFKECKSCGNAAKDYQIIRCKECLQIAGCFKDGLFGGNGCASKIKSQKKCPKCGNDGWLLNWWEVAGVIK